MKRIAAWAALGGLTACSLGALDGLSGPVDGGAASDAVADGTTGDAGTVTDSAPVDGPIAGGDLVDNGGFEQGTTTCLAWQAEARGDAVRVTTAHQGAASCRLCAVAPTTRIYLSGNRIIVPAGVTSIALQAWVHAAPDAGTSTTLVASGSADLYLADGGYSAHIGTNNAFPNDTWTRVIVTAPVDGASFVYPGVAAYDPNGAQLPVGTCVDIDDVSVTPQ